MAKEKPERKRVQIDVKLINALRRNYKGERPRDEVTMTALVELALEKHLGIRS